MIGEKVGSQDQTIAAFGGLNKIEFGGRQEIAVSPLVIKESRLKEFESNLLLFFTDFSRIASKIAAEQIKKIPTKNNELIAMRQPVDEGISILQSKRNLEDFGKLLDHTWQIKRTLSSKITNPQIDAIYEAGIKAGATGGKLLGAGGGGFMMFYARPELHKRIKQKLNKFLSIPFRFDHLGSQIIYVGKHDF